MAFSQAVKAPGREGLLPPQDTATAHNKTGIAKASSSVAGKKKAKKQGCSGFFLSWPCSLQPFIFFPLCRLSFVGSGFALHFCCLTEHRKWRDFSGLFLRRKGDARPESLIQYANAFRESSSFMENIVSRDWLLDK